MYPEQYYIWKSSNECWPNIMRRIYKRILFKLFQHVSGKSGRDSESDDLGVGTRYYELAFILKLSTWFISKPPSCAVPQPYSWMSASA